MLVRTGTLISFILSIVVSSVSISAAQDSSIVGELERLRRDMNTLQGYVFRDGKGAPPAGSSTGVPGFASQDSVSQIQLQMQEIRRQMREMNGQFEQIQFKISRTAERLDRLVADVDLRLRALEEGRVVVPSQQNLSERSPDQIQSTPGSETTIISSSSATASAASSDGRLQSGQQAFGVISKTDLKRFKETGNVVPSTQPPTLTRQTARAPQKARSVAKPVAAPRTQPVTTVANTSASKASGQLASLPEGTPKSQYDYAYGLLMKRELPKAEAALKAFLANHPEHELADNATFWLGETYYTRKNYQEAIRVYYDAYKRYPKGNKAPAVLLKLGMSLATIGEKESACSAYDELAKSHPKASPRILGNAARAKKSLGCN